jgi:hypothetical protein
VVRLLRYADPEAKDNQQGTVRKQTNMSAHGQTRPRAHERGAFDRMFSFKSGSVYGVNGSIYISKQLMDCQLMLLHSRLGARWSNIDMMSHLRQGQGRKHL